MVSIRNDLDAKCIECGGKITLGNVENRECIKCGNKVLDREMCENGHYVCDACRRKIANKMIYKKCSETSSKDPIEIMNEIMNDDSIRMHDLEHHIMVASCLLAAYRNSGADIDLDKALRDAEKRGAWFPAGVCGFCGTCGAAASTGIFYSIIVNSTPRSKESWSDTIKMTSSSLEKISAYNGPRCCKRNGYISILNACDYVEKKLNVKMEPSKNIICGFSERNEDCIKEECPFYQ